MIRNNKLEVFENFQIDHNLPKYGDKKQEVNLQGSFSGGITINTGTATTNGVTFGNWNTFAPSVPVQMDDFDGDSLDEQILRTSPYSPQEKGFFAKLFSRNEKKKIEKEKIKANKIKTVTIVQFFSSLGNNLQDLGPLTDIAVHYETLITNAQNAGQIALVEKLKARLEAAKTETILVTHDLKKYLTEQQIIDFYNQAEKDRALKLTWIKNFIKPIPSKILDVKKELDAKFTFDNYVILHYDPKNDATNLTKEEKDEVERRKKDPILFGVIQSSRRLYYIGDWIDEYCNLTLDTVIETLGDNVGEINNESVKTYIDRGFPKEDRFPLPKKDEEKKEVINPIPSTRKKLTPLKNQTKKRK